MSLLLHSAKKSFQQDMMMEQFMAMLNENENKDSPPTKLLDLAGQLCQDLQSLSPNLEKVVEAVMRCKNKTYFLTNIHVVRACVSIHIHKGQHDTACRLLEYCKAEEKEELVQLWYEIHYQRFMKKHQRDTLTSLQKFRCRKRNPPPLSLCPEGLKNRNYSKEVRQRLHRFAAEVTASPNKKQRERLSQDLNLQPSQVYNWFANYRRRQRSRRPTEKLNNSPPPERALASQTNELQDKGTHTPQTAGESQVGVSPEQKDTPLMPCEPKCEQPATPLYKPPEGTYLTMLESSCVQSTEPYGAATSTALFSTHNTQPPVPSYTEAVVEPGTCFVPAVLLPGGAVSSAAASPQQGSFVLHSYNLPFPNEWLPRWEAPYSTREVPGSVWIQGVEAGIRAPLSTVPQGGYVEASSGGIIQQSHVEAESFMLRGGQLGTLESISHSSSGFPVSGNPQCPPVFEPSVEERQAVGQSQVLEDPVRDSLSDDTFQAACLLFEFAASARM